FRVMHCTSDYGNERAQVQLRISRSVLTLLKFVVRSDRLKTVIGEIHRLVSLPYALQPPTIELDSVWEDIYSELQTVQSLKHMCRTVINTRLIAADPEVEIQAKIDQLPLPSSLKTYLTYNDDDCSPSTPIPSVPVA